MIKCFKGEIWIYGICSEAAKEAKMHYFSWFAAFDDESCLSSEASGKQALVDG
jgi:hypothetical protein